MNEDCRKVQEALLDLAYADPDAPNGGIVQLVWTNTSKTARNVVTMPIPSSPSLRCCQHHRGKSHLVAMGTRPRRTLQLKASIRIGPGWMRPSSGGVRMRVARERRDIALFALTATGILTAVWVPLLAWSPRAFLGVQAVGGFLGIALFYLPIHVLRERKGDAS